MFLTADELRELTRKVRPSAQRAELDAMGIPFQTRRDGSIVVLRVAVEGILGHAEATPKQFAPALRL